MCMSTTSTRQALRSRSRGQALDPRHLHNPSDGEAAWRGQGLGAPCVIEAIFFWIFIDFEWMRKNFPITRSEVLGGASPDLSMLFASVLHHSATAAAGPTAVLVLVLAIAIASASLGSGSSSPTTVSTVSTVSSPWSVGDDNDDLVPPCHAVAGYLLGHPRQANPR